jgi:hypothetical protein
MCGCFSEALSLRLRFLGGEGGGGLGARGASDMAMSVSLGVDAGAFVGVGAFASSAFVEGLDAGAGAIARIGERESARAQTERNARV